MTANQKRLLNRFPVGEPVLRDKIEKEYERDHGSMSGFMPAFGWLLKNRILDIIPDTWPQKVRRRTPQEIADLLIHRAAHTGKPK